MCYYSSNKNLFINKNKMKNKKVLLSVLGAVALVAVFWAVQYGNVGTQGYL